MRGNDQQPEAELFMYGPMEERIPADHPLRRVRPLVDAVLRSMTRQFEVLYAANGRPSIAPERLLRALVLQVLYSIRSERMLVEQLEYNLLYRWFVGMDSRERAWNHAVFSKNRERLLNREVAELFFERVKGLAAGLMSDEHFTVDGTLIEAWAGHKSFRPKQGPGGGGRANGEFRGEKRRNDTHESTTDPEARLYRKGNGQEAKLAYLGHLLVENRNGLIAAAMATRADGMAERDAGLLLAQQLEPRRRRTLGADKGYDSRDFVSTVRELGFTPHVNQNTSGRRSAIDGRTTCHAGYRVSLSKRWLVEKPFGWMKSVGWIRKVKLRGLAKVGWAFVFGCAAYNLIRIPKLRQQPA